MEKVEEGIKVSLNITLLVSEVPAGLAHTKIIFQEAP